MVTDGPGIQAFLVLCESEAERDNLINLHAITVRHGEFFYHYLPTRETLVSKDGTEFVRQYLSQVHGSIEPAPALPSASTSDARKRQREQGDLVFPLVNFFSPIDDV